ncbi:MAG: hypothetical protein GC157_03265 [Frankiales bacterium]|nr:hypothetical protein [Frankiales bacterium]
MTSATRIRSFAVLRAAWGGALLAAPDRLFCAANAHQYDELGVAAARVLGGRDLVQGLVTALLPRTSVRRAGAAVDAVHALSMLAVAATPSATRRAALVSGLLASAELGIGLRLAR